MIFLWGKPKGETSDRKYKIPCISITKSGINVKTQWRGALRSKKRRDM